MKSKTPNEVKRKAFSFKLDETDDQGVIKGYGSVFNVRDSHNEVVLPGAFSDSLNRQKREGSYPLMLWQHDTYEPAGVWDDLSDDGKGLYSEGRLLINQQVPTADKVFSLAKAKAVRGLSIGYREIDIEPGSNGEPTKLKELDLVEISIVSLPANRRALIDSVKNLSEGDIRALDAWKRFEDWARRVGDGETPAPSEFEDLLRDARVSKSQRTRIASRVHLVLRSESGDKSEATSKAIAAVEAAVKRFG